LYPVRILTLLACALPSAAANYSTYIGDAYLYNVAAIAVDSSGNTYVTGMRQISLSTPPSSTTDIFVSKLDPSGNLTLLTTIAGKASDQAK
jgi:Beta-propeller repeat